MTAAPVSANGGSDAVRGARCVVAGVKFLASNGLLVKAALRQVDYDTIDSDGGGDAGLINADLPTPAFLPLGDGDPASLHEPGALRLVQHLVPRSA